MRGRYEKWDSLTAGVCEEPTCGQAVPEHAPGKRGRVRFCSFECYRLYDRRTLKRGRRLYEAAVRWRAAPRKQPRNGPRNPPNPYFPEVTRMVDEFLREDREMRMQRMAACAR